MHGIGQKIKIHMNFIDENVLVSTCPNILTNLYFRLFSSALTLRYSLFWWSPMKGISFTSSGERIEESFRCEQAELDVFSFMFP